MTSQTTYALALSLFERRNIARKGQSWCRLVAPRWLREFAPVCLCVAVASLAILWALFASNLTLAARFNGSCGAILWPC